MYIHRMRPRSSCFKYSVLWHACSASIMAIVYIQYLQYTSKLGGDERQQHHQNSETDRYTSQPRLGYCSAFGETDVDFRTSTVETLTFLHILNDTNTHMVHV